jgi:alpha-galactosidase
MSLEGIELRYRDEAGNQRSLALNDSDGSASEAGLTIAVRRERGDGRTIVRASVANRGSAAVRLDSIWFRIATGFPSQAPARFFKHGYQSWSESRPLAVGTMAHPRDGALFLIRLNHQSEVTRPPDAPEAATSEQFTIVESDSSPERFVAGFIGAAHQLATITVAAPDRVSARAILDGVALRRGEERDIEPLAFWRTAESESAGRIAARFAAMLGRAMNARVGARYQRGWCSWYHYFHAITEDALRTNLRALKAMRSEYPIELVQLDDGYQAALGDWDRTNAKFPSGLARIACEIRDAGFTAGIWTAPFLAARDSQIMREHPDWFIRHENGEPLRAGYNSNWTADEDKFAYALDPGNPEFAAHLERLFKRIVEEFGYDYLKLDFLYAAAAEGIRHNPDLTRAETLRWGLDAIRRGAGEQTFILGCGCPLGPAVGVVDGMRIGPDVAPYWGGGAGETGAPGTALAIDAILARSFMHRRLWLNDPDCLMLRAKQTQLTDDERNALAWAIAVSGGMLLISDDMSLLGADSARLFQAVARIGAEVDASCDEEPPMLANVMTMPSVRTLSARVRDGALHLLLNMAGSAAQVRLAEALPPHQEAKSVGIYGEAGAPATIDLSPHSARIIRTR